VLGLAAIDVVWSSYAGLCFVHCERAALAVATMASVAAFYSATGRSSRITHMAHQSALWIAFSLTGAIFTYLTSTICLPLHDEQLHAVDVWLGFDWLAWYRILQTSPLLSVLLHIAYFSLILQIIASIIYFSYAGRPNRGYELWWGALFSLVLTAIISGLVPAQGAGMLLGEPGIPLESYLPHLQALRDGSANRFAVETIQGIVTFPSYHTVLAVLLVYAYRTERQLLWAIAALNILMLLSIPPYGSHYLVDMLAGAAVAFVAIVVTWLTRRSWNRSLSAV